MSTMMLTDLKLLAIFSSVVECQSFAAAARMLATSRSRVSEQVALLESRLGVRLLQRSTRKLKLTDEGLKVYLEAQKLTEILQSVEAVIAPEEPSGRVAITLNHDIAHQFILPLLRDFRQACPKIELDLILDDAPRDLIAEQIDLAIRIGFPKDSSLVARVLHEECFQLFCSPGLLDEIGEVNDFQQLTQQPWVILSQTFFDGVVRLRDANDELRELRPSSVNRCNSPFMVQQMVKAGMGISALLPSTVREDIAAARLLPILPDLQSEKIVFSLVYPSRKQLPLRTRAVVDFLLQNNPFHSL